jgi:predicted phosphodiesterase
MASGDWSMDYLKLAKTAQSDLDKNICKAMHEEGTQRKAARRLGMAQSYLCERLQKLRSGPSAEAKVKEERARNKILEDRIEELEKRIHELRGSGRKVLTPRESVLEGGARCRVAIPDTHGCLADTDAIEAMLGDLQIIKPKEIVMLGDHLECGGFLAQHHTLGYVAQTEYTFDQDVQATNELLDRIQEVRPESIDYLEGNHERRIENWCVTQALRNTTDAEYLRRMFSAGSVLSLEERGIRWIQQGQCYDDVPLPATIKKGHCYFTHGSSTAKHAAAEHVRKFGGNVVYGHTHRADFYVIRTVSSGPIGGWSPGCLCNMQPLWQHTNPTDWSQGYGLQLVSDDGSFLHINVPIINGKSYLGPLFQEIAR